MWGFAIMKTRFKVTASKIVAAEEDEIFMNPSVGEMDDIDDSFSEQLDDVADTVEDIQDVVTDDDHQEDSINIEVDNNIAGHYIAECDKCKNVFISATVLSDQIVNSVSGICPICREESEQYLKWVIQPVEEVQ
jgi:hypothetical protein